MTREPLGVLVITVLALILAPARAEPVPEAYQRVADEERVPAAVLYALARTVTPVRLADGTIRPWPWTLTIDARPQHFRDRRSAARALTGATQSGHPVQVGLMQLDWQRYRHRYASTPQVLFDPWLNLRLAARELRLHFNDSGRWSLAAARYTGALRARRLALAIDARRRLELAPLIRASAARHGLPSALVEALIATESTPRLPVNDMSSMSKNAWMNSITSF